MSRHRDLHRAGDVVVTAADSSNAEKILNVFAANQIHDPFAVEEGSSEGNETGVAGGEHRHKLELGVVAAKRAEDVWRERLSTLSTLIVRFRRINRPSAP